MDEAKIRIEYMALSQIARAPRNPKDHDVDAVGESIRRFGFVAPIVLDENTGRLVAGHGRLETLQRAKAAGDEPPDRIVEKDGDWLVPVVRGVSFADEQEAEAYVVADNRTVELGGWDEEMLAKVLSDHSDSAKSFAGMGYDQDDLDKLLRKLGEDTPIPDFELKSQFLVIVTCKDEAEQRELLERMTQERRKVRAVIS